MHTVLVVDDEAIVCQGIKDFLEASDLGIGQVLTAWNGYEALDYLRMESVDLVLTDIQMDGMNGIELMESILSEKPDIPVVVISAHDEFDYAQKCIRLGARDYLIKPVLLPQLLEIVRRALFERHEKYKLLLEDSLKLKFSLAGISSLRTYLLNEWLSGSLASADDYRYMMDQFGLSLRGPAFSVFVIELQWDRAGIEQAPVQTLKDRNLLKYAAVNIAEETLSDWEALAFYGPGNRVYAILQLKESALDAAVAEHQTKLHMIGHTLAGNLSQYLHLTAIVGMSPFRPGVESLPGSCREACDAVRWQGLYGGHQVFFADDFSKKEALDEADWQERTDRFVAWMKTGRRADEVREAVDRLMDDIGPVFEREDAAAGIPLSIAYRVYALLLERIDTAGDRYRSLDPLVYFRFPLASLEIKRRLTSFLTEAADLIYSSMTDHDQAVIRQAVDYIKRQFRCKGLKIQDVADHVHLSPNYLSYLFKLITEETVWEYVTKLRMEESRHLLRHTAKKRYEIADEVGYESPEHFSRVFKRYFGESPNTVRG
ncbi:response regulator [Cohnella nanjingensis]|uniref:Response regulator n=1 Tax=Cohnella nanjingensis TaxID=1387779 RepID=A0A7X0VGH9_9BACL|nr:response regulator [Cohnella nanjingensis]MBB6673117.1 response regulator [Cohnella nanjingensis]